MNIQENVDYKHCITLDGGVNSRAKYFSFSDESPSSRIFNKYSLPTSEDKCCEEPDRKRSLNTPIKNDECLLSSEYKQSKSSEEYKRDDSFFSSPVVPLDEGDVFFATDEMGEISIGYFDQGVDYYNICWSYDTEKDCKDRKRIRKNISKSITPTNTVRSSSPQGVVQELQINAFEWYEQQKHHRQLFSKLKSPITHQENGIIEVESPRWIRWNSASPQSSASILPEYGDSPSPSCLENNFDIPIPTPSPSISPEPKESNEYEVCTNLPEPNKEWYSDFFGKKPTLCLAVMKKSPDLLSRFSFRKSITSKNTSVSFSPVKEGLKIPHTLQNVLDEEELLFLGGYRDHGDGLYEC